MADLTERDRRGQILLVTGFALAVIFVGLALVLNSVIYAENLATRTESDTVEPVSHSRSLTSGTADLVSYINTYNTSMDTGYDELAENLTVGFRNISEGTARGRLMDGVVTDDVLRNQFNGTVLTQTNESRNFTNAGGATDWSPVNSSANGARGLRIQVTSLLANDFTVLATNGSHTWTLGIDGSTVSYTDASGNTGSCSTPSTPFWVNVTAGTVDGTDCSGLDFGDDLDIIQTVEFADADDVEGTYSLLVNETESSLATGPIDYGADTKGPFTKPGIYGAVVGIDFERPSLVYRTDVRVVPGESDD